MTLILIRKLLRDIWVPLLVVAVLLCAFEMLWAHVTRRITADLLPKVTGYILQQQMTSPFWIMPGGQDAAQAEKIAQDLQQIVFEGPGKIIQAMVGGQEVKQGQPLDFARPLNMMSIGYVHPLLLTILCIWAVGRSAGAIAGEIDRGTMELLLAQPIARWQIIAAHAAIDLITIPAICLSLWGGTCLGAWLVGLQKSQENTAGVHPLAFAPAMLFVACLLFSISGYTLWISALGRLRGRVMGIAILATLLQFLVNLVGQLWDVLLPFRPLTVFYYYQPQAPILDDHWIEMSSMLDTYNAFLTMMTANNAWLNLGILLGVGSIGYLLALWTFCRRNLPAPL